MASYMWQFRHMYGPYVFCMADMVCGLSGLWPFVAILQWSVNKVWISHQFNFQFQIRIHVLEYWLISGLNTDYRKWSVNEAKIGADRVQNRMSGRKENRAENWIAEMGLCAERLFMAAHVVSSFLWSPYVTDHYIFALWFLSSFFFLFSPRLISAIWDWMSTILPHMVWP